MGLATFGVSGGQAVTNQLGGVTLSQINDYAVIQVSNVATPGGPDASGLFAISGEFTGVSVALQFVPDKTAFSAENWQNLNTAVRNDTNAPVNGAFALTNNTAIQLSTGPVTGLYAVRVLLTAISTGELLVSGNTNPGSPAGLDSTMVQQQQAMITLLRAVVLGLSDMASTPSNPVDYLSAVGGTW